MTADDGTVAPSGEQIEISFGDRRAVVVEVGGGIRSFSAGGRDVLDGYGVDDPASSGRGQVLVPCPNRLQDGSYEQGLHGPRERRDGRARVGLRDPDSGAAVTLWMDEGYGHLMLFTGDTRADVKRRSIAVEPTTCPPNAFRTGDCLIRLEPGEASVATWGITPS